jgi:hypothetical protein
MKSLRLFAGVALAAAFATTLPAQQPAGGFHTVACLKLKPGKADDYRKWRADEGRKVFQARVDDGEITGSYLLRSVLPQNSADSCDYVSVTMFPGTPHLLGTEELSAAIKKAGLTISPQDFINHRDEVITVASVIIAVNVASAGSPKKGDYFRVNFVKAPDVGEWVDNEKKVWQPLWEAMIKDGLMAGWSVNVQVLPSGSGLPNQGVTVDVLSKWDDMFANFSQTQMEAHWKKVHPDMDPSITLKETDKLRTIVLTQVYQLDDLVTK